MFKRLVEIEAAVHFFTRSRSYHFGVLEGSDRFGAAAKLREDRIGILTGDRRRGHFTRALAVEGKRNNIRANVLTPSIVGGTEFYERIMADPFTGKLFGKAVPKAELGLVDMTDLAGIAVATYLKDLVPYSPPGILDMAWDERTRVFQEGGCAMTYVWSGNAAAWETDPSSPAHGHVAYVPHPSGLGAPNRSTLGGWSLAIPANLPADRQKLAWDAIKGLTSKDMMIKYTENGTCVSPRHSVSQDPDVVSRCAVIKAVDDFANAGEIASWQRPPVPELQQMVDVLGTQMHEVISGKKTPEAGVKESQALIDRIMKKAGYY